MAYLLLNGSKTENLGIYLRDVLFLNFSFIPKDIPFNTALGIDRYVLENSKTNFIDQVRNSINDLLNRLNDRHGSDLSIKSMYMNSDTLDVSLDFGEFGSELYEIPLTEL